MTLNSVDPIGQAKQSNLHDIWYNHWLGQFALNLINDNTLDLTGSDIAGN